MEAAYVPAVSWGWCEITAGGGDYKLQVSLALKPCSASMTARKWPFTIAVFIACGHIE